MSRDPLTDSVRAYPPDEPSGGGCPCPLQMEFYVDGQPTSGQFTWTLNGASLVLNFDDNTNEVVTAINAMAAYSGVVGITNSASGLPYSSVIVQFPKDTVMPAVAATLNTFDDGVMKIRYRP